MDRGVGDRAAGRGVLHRHSRGAGDAWSVHRQGRHHQLHRHCQRDVRGANVPVIGRVRSAGLSRVPGHSSRSYTLAKIPLPMAALCVTWISAGIAASSGARAFGDIRVGWALTCLIPHYLINSSLGMSEAPLLAAEMHRPDALARGTRRSGRSRVWSRGVDPADGVLCGRGRAVRADVRSPLVASDSTCGSRGSGVWLRVYRDAILDRQRPARRAYLRKPSPARMPVT